MFNTLSHKRNANQNSMRFHLTQVGMAIIKKMNAGKEGLGEGTLTHY
jgi:hypothetical protein